MNGTKFSLSEEFAKKKLVILPLKFAYNILVIVSLNLGEKL